MIMDLQVTKWVDRVSLHWIEMLLSGCDGAPVFVVRSPFGESLNNQGTMEVEPSPSNRDSDFLNRCRFTSFKDAAKALENYLESL
jgi:hypothetical protein